ncbi:hypothetical protein QE152_g9699 [Popillia japonica]|uniref:Uncharacterized protein n=1 Tax=Popillia japonica TaxID=7064 RepID=A0AAW1LZD8_POPJA
MLKAQTTLRKTLYRKSPLDAVNQQLPSFHALIQLRDQLEEFVSNKCQVQPYQIIVKKLNFKKNSRKLSMEKIFFSMIPALRKFVS